MTAASHAPRARHRTPHPAPRAPRNAHATAGQWWQRFAEARGEAGEVACWVELLIGYQMATGAEALEVLERADRAGAMLTKLIRSAEAGQR